MGDAEKQGLETTRDAASPPPSSSLPPPYSSPHQYSQQTDIRDFGFKSDPIHPNLADVKTAE